MEKKHSEFIAALDSLMMDVELPIKVCLDITKNNEWIERRSRHDYDLWIVMEGQIRVIIGQKEYIMNPYDVLLLTPQTFYKASCVGESCRFAFVHFDAIIGNNNRVLEGMPFVGPTYASVIEPESKHFIECYHRHGKGEVFSSLSLRGALYSLLGALLKDQITRGIKERTHVAEKAPLFRVYMILNYIEDHLSESIQIQDLATIINMSPKYFISFFKKAVGTSPAQYILRSRMKKALELIYEQEYTVKEVAAMVGYSDPYTFSKAFKKIYDCAPSHIESVEKNILPFKSK